MGTQDPLGRPTVCLHRGQLGGMGHQDCVQQETPKVTSYGIPWAHEECGTLCGGLFFIPYPGIESVC